MEAKYRLIFEELLLLQTGLLSIRKKMNLSDKGILFSKKVLMDSFLSSFPFSLTGAQQRVIGEINADMESGKVMNRLVQGDVGSGKTIVAAACIRL